MRALRFQPRVKVEARDPKDSSTSVMKIGDLMKEIDH